jgi:hypothetical protein
MRRLWRRTARTDAAPEDASAAPREQPVERFFFIHVMKTGGMSLFQQFRSNFPLDALYPTRDIDIRYDGKFRHLELPYLLAIPQERRDRLRLYAGHFPYVACEMLDGGFVTLTLLRDPVERTISLLRQLQRNVDWIGPNHAGDEPPPERTLEEIYDDAVVFDALIHDHQTKIFSMTVADNPQSYRQTIDVDAARLALAKANLARVDVVGLMDGYDDFLDELAAQFGWSVRHDIRSNEAPAGEEPEPVSDALRARIVADNAIDIEFYEYAKELVAARRGAVAPTPSHPAAAR